MPGIKPIFFKLTTPLIKTIGLKTLSEISNCHFILPLYHCINEKPPAHIKYLYPVNTPGNFLRDIELLLKHFQPVTLEELIQITKENTIPKKPVFHLTFDDGLSEFDSYAAPILLKKSIPATCFLNSEFIDNKAMFYRFKASILIDHLHNQPVGSKAWNIFHAWLKENHLQNKYYRKVLLDIDYEKQNFLESLAKELKVDFKNYLKKYKPYLDKDQIQSLIKKGFTFGAHSMDHPDYRFIDEPLQIEQTLNSIDIISSAFGLDYKVFSFPFTDHEISMQFFHCIQDKTDLSFGCAGIKKDTAFSNLQRIPVEEYNLSMQDTLKKELLYYFLLRIINKHKIIRH
ncbi:MAG: polysaccharide deacetylase family protein [Bacteroidales bacterium]|nr:polysaccharide deacetylase family protein [Bacteroidales bacterium]